MDEKEKSAKRRKKAVDAITALGIPGVLSTRNLEAWLIYNHSQGVPLAMFYVQPDSSLLSVSPQDIDDPRGMRFVAAPAPFDGDAIISKTMAE